MTRYLWAALIILVLFWPSAASADTLDGATTHVRKLANGTEVAIFKVELRHLGEDGVTGAWRLVLSTGIAGIAGTQSCTATPFDETPPALEGVLQQDVHATALWTPL